MYYNEKLVQKAQITNKKTMLFPWKTYPKRCCEYFWVI